MQNVLTELTKYFSEEKDVYVQNVSNGIVSLAFGEKLEVGYSLPAGPNPICLTSQVPFKLIKESVIFRKALLRKPPFVRLLSYEEYTQFFERKAKVVEKSPEQLIEDAELKQQKFADKVMDDEPTETPPVSSATEPETLDEVLTPRVIQLVNNLNQPSEEEGGIKISIPDIVEELDTLQLKYEDLEYVRSMGRFRTVKKWAEGKLKEVDDKSIPTTEEIEKSVNK